MNARNISICELARAFPYEREFAGEKGKCKTADYGMGRHKVEYSMSPLEIYG